MNDPDFDTYAHPTQPPIATIRVFQVEVANDIAVGYRHGLGVGVQCSDAGAEPECDVVVGVELGRFERDIVGCGAQHVLRQRRPVIRQVLLVANDRDRTGVVSTPKFLGGAYGGESPADYDDACACGHGAFLHEPQAGCTRLSGLRARCMPCAQQHVRLCAACTFIAAELVVSVT